MTNLAPAQKSAGGLALVRRVIRLPFAAAAAVVELAICRRAVALAYLLVALAFTVRGGWLRPPLSSDILSIHLSTGLHDKVRLTPEQILQDVPRHASADSLGAFLCAVIALGVVLVLIRPQWLGLAAGMLLAGALAMYAAAAFNYPALIELLDFEYQQRGGIVGVLGSIDETALANVHDGRVQKLSFLQDALEGWNYVLAGDGKWLAVLAAAGVFFGGPGRTHRRLQLLVIWIVLGVLLSIGCCFPRLRAERHWLRAEYLEDQRDFAASRGEADLAFVIFPELERLQRSWALLGKLDFRQGRHTKHEQFWRVSQFVGLKEYPQALALAQDLYKQVIDQQQIRTCAGDENTVAIRYQLAQLRSQIGLQYYAAGRLMAARDSWRRAIAIDPQCLDCPFFLGTLQALTDRHHPELVDEAYRPLRLRLADRVMLADVLATLGDAYFEACQMEKARQCYRESEAAFDLPKHVNFHAEQGLGGL